MLISLSRRTVTFVPPAAAFSKALASAYTCSVPLEVTTSATGTANGALTHYLHRQHLIPCPGECRFLQGEAMRRPSIIATMLHDDGSINVGGQYCIIARGELLP